MAASPESGRIVRGRRGSYGPFALTVAVVVLLGFIPTYWRPVVLGPATLGPFVHVHAGLFFGWVALFAAQAVLAQRGRTALHRRLGMLGGAWIVATAVVAFRLALTTIARDLDRVDGTANAVGTLIPLTQAVLFSGFAGLGLLNVRRPGIHRRFMMLAGLVSVAPAFARIGIGLLGPTSPLLPVFTFVAATGLLATVVAYDVRRSGRLHPVFLWGGAVLVAVRIVRVPFAMSDAWRSVAGVIAFVAAGAR